MEKWELKIGLTLPLDIRYIVKGVPLALTSGVGVPLASRSGASPATGGVYIHTRAKVAINTAMVVPNLNKSHHAVIIFVAVIMAMGVGASLGCIAMTVRNYGWRVVWNSRIREEKVIVLGAVRLPKRATPAELELGALATVDAPAEEWHTR